MENFWKQGKHSAKINFNWRIACSFYRKNDEKFRWIENHTWRLKSEIFINEKLNNPTLVCQNIDTYGEIIVNGENIYSASNYFIPHEIALDKYLKNGINTIEIILTPPKIYHKKDLLLKNFITQLQMMLIASTFQLLRANLNFTLDGTGQLE